MSKSIVMAAAAGTVAAVGGTTEAAVSYDTAGSTYKQNFDGLPTQHPSGASIPSNAPLQPSPYPEGWRDDTTSDSNHISLPGWYLYHQTSVASGGEGGFNGNQRLRYGQGNSTVGAFYAYASAVTDSEKALGILSSNSIQPVGGRAYMGLQLINNTGTTLTSFTITYDGEQWRDGGSQGSVDRLDFQYSLTKDASNWFDSTGYVGIADSFVAIHDNATASGLNGNDAANRRAGITHTINDISWEPGTQLWIRWRDGNIANNDDGMAIDNVEFSAVPEPTGLAALALGAIGLLARRRRASA